MIHKEDPRWVDKYNDPYDVAKKVASDVKAIFKKIEMKKEITKMPEHIQRLVDEANATKLNSVEYWKLRSTYLEKYLDTTYSQLERDNCYMLFRILRRREWDLV